MLKFIVWTYFIFVGFNAVGSSGNDPVPGKNLPVVMWHGMGKKKIIFAMKQLIY